MSPRNDTDLYVGESIKAALGGYKVFYATPPPNYSFNKTNAHNAYAVYNRDDSYRLYGGNKIYAMYIRYSITLVASSKTLLDNLVESLLDSLELCKEDRYFNSGNGVYNCALILYAPRKKG